MEGIKKSWKTGQKCSILKAREKQTALCVINIADTERTEPKMEIRNRIKAGELDALLTKLYGAPKLAAKKERFFGAIDSFAALYGERDGLRLFSAPGRTEIGGNHTDHNHGRVLAGSVDLDVIAVVSFNDSGIVRIKSEGYEMDTVDIGDLTARPEEQNQAVSLIRGTLARFQELGYRIGGFDAYTTSNVLKGSGLSSSAAFEVLIGRILSSGYNDEAVDAVEIARIAQYAENNYFGKPCGLMDQMASSVGNIITIDFADPAKPIIERVDFDFAASGYALCIVDTGGNHADLTHEYAAIPEEMRAIAQEMGCDYLRETTLAAVLEKLPGLRKRHGDRAALRAIHFLKENERVAEQVAALRDNDLARFRELVIESGRSSFCWLQNVYACSNVSEQGLSLALCLAEDILAGSDGGWRVHGGGFGGTTQNFVPLSLLETFRSKMEAVFGEGSCHVLNIRPYGGIEIK